MSRYGERALELQSQGCNCCQSVVASMCEKFGVDEKTALRFAAVFGSGIGFMAETCGAVTGAMMLIGLAMGDGMNSDPEKSEAAYDTAQKFIERFRSEHDGCTKCRELLGVDTSTDEGYEYVLKNDLYTKVCRGLIRDGAETIADILLPEGGKSR